HQCAGALGEAALGRADGGNSARRGCVDLRPAGPARYFRSEMMRMFRITDIVLVIAMVGAAAFTYTTKHAAEAEYAKIRKLEAAIRLEEESIDLLKADWSLLTQPSRLQKLADRYYDDLHLVPIEPHQIAEFNELPERVLRIEELLGGTEATANTQGVDDLTTSGVQEWSAAGAKRSSRRICRASPSSLKGLPRPAEAAHATVSA